MRNEERRHKKKYEKKKMDRAIAKALAGHVPVRSHSKKETKTYEHNRHERRAMLHYIRESNRQKTQGAFGSC